MILPLWPATQIVIDLAVAACAVHQIGMPAGCSEASNVGWKDASRWRW